MRHNPRILWFYTATVIAVYGLSGYASEPPQQDNPSSPQWEEAIRNYEKMDQEKRPEPGGVVFIGSSSIGGWKTLKEDFAPINVIGRGFGGSQLIDSVVYAHRIVIPYHPEAVVLYAGDNDIASEKTPEQVFGDFKKFVEKIHAALPETRIYFICIKPSIKRWEIWDKMKATNSMVAEFAKENDLVEYLDVATPMMGKDGKPRPELFVEDGLHMSAAGYKIWTEVVKPYLKMKSD